MISSELLKKNIESKLDWAADYLGLCEVSSPRLDAELIMSHVLERKKAEFFTTAFEANYSFKEDELKRFERLVHLRGTRYPLQYITGLVDFMGLDLKVKPGVFIPRPETEILVENATRRVSGNPFILDLCTGSGNIAVSLAKFLEGATVMASDISDDALKIAEDNIKLHKRNNIKLIKSDLFENIDEYRIDLIISNPPYVAEEDFESLMPELLYEPISSLYGGSDGLYFYRKIFDKASFFLAKDGYLIVEIGYNQIEQIKNILSVSNKLFVEEVVKDYNGIDRVVVIRRKNG
ncbi:MAG: peptide chain release factor N(5)-glutamine methyltransferase [Candidatus Omnitrophica bacterium CG07_land_8_20_14_0_80_42_15]|uniref:Release factor glutamine methyltransferase n=1 Tax=Candidatus Aquitaenariimonas noxiae TaxID=1974741 RepID=A0A2J0KW52_9BACT|nr:MAG: peptide chain release factor N(5)-glutamine methyltransferase [Candidatus Omnitrophica bacterium CG07_land_8_20_14_0_80_42_15]